MSIPTNGINPKIHPVSKQIKVALQMSQNRSRVASKPPPQIRTKSPCQDFPANCSITGSHVKSEKNCRPDILTSRSEQSHSANPHPRFSDKSRVTLAIPQNQVELPKAVKFALNAFNEFNCDTNFSTETTIFSKNAVTGSDVRARKCYDDMLSII